MRNKLSSVNNLSIVIPTMTAEFTKDLINSLIKYTDIDDIEIIVVANGCSRDLVEYINSLNINIVLLWYDNPLGAVRSFNEGIKVATKEYILLLNDDCSVLESDKNFWINALLQPFDDPLMACTGPYRMTPRLGMMDLKFPEDRLNYGFILFFCALIPRKIFEEIGLLDETLNCGVDVDFCMKLKDRGYKIQQVPEDEYMDSNEKWAFGSFPFFHDGEGTVHSFYGDKWQEILIEDSRELNKRYGKQNQNQNIFKPSISILVPVFGGRIEEIKKCFSSILENTDLDNVNELIVVANGCSSEVTEYLNTISSSLNFKSKLILHEYLDALGATGAINELFRLSRSEICVVLNQDVVLLNKYWLNILIGPFKDKKVGATGPLKSPINESDYEFLMFFCTAIRKDTLNEVGVLDMNFNPGGFEDADFFIRVQEKGWKIVQVPVNESDYVFDSFNGNFPIFHIENHWDWMSEDIYIRNRDYFLKKWAEYLIPTNTSKKRTIVPSWPMAQKKHEIMAIQEFLKNYNINKVLEIGTYRGGTALLWAKMVEKVNGHVYCLDMNFDWGDFSTYGYEEIEEKIYRRQVYNDTHYEDLITEFKGDTHDQQFVEMIKREVGVVDLIFIDGDHSYEGVKADFFNYCGLVKEDGYVLFHDIIDSDIHRQSGVEVCDFWNEIKNSFEHWEFIDSNEYPMCPSASMGIGIIKMAKEVFNNYNIREINSSNKKVTAYISTKDRYHTTLPLAIMGIASQSHLPDEFILVDDGEQKDLRNDPVYDGLFKLLDEKHIDWKVVFGGKKGQVANHQMILDTAKHDFIYRCDDDNFPESDVLKTLLSYMNEDVGAVATSCLIPGDILDVKDTSGTIQDINLKGNVQWSRFNGVKEVDHLYNSFLFRKKAAEYGYPQFLSPVGHREETIFSHSIKKNGWKLLVCGNVTTWHLRQPTGGIRTFNDHQMWDHDESLFLEWLKIQDSNKFDDACFIAILDCGLGDHLDFLSILPDVRKKYVDKKIVLATCFPEVFKDEKDIEQISISEAKLRFGNIEKYNVYNFMTNNNWNKNIKEAFRELYL